MPTPQPLYSMTETGIVILAAGSSSRLGQPKQNLLFQGQTLLQRILQTALTSTIGQVVLVLGANAPSIESSLDVTRVKVAHNPAWESGMASSIKTGLSALLETSPETNGMLVLLCDQPFITPALLQEMVKSAETTGKGMVACSYQGTLGAPVLFQRKFFEELHALTGQDGAKKLLLRFPEEVTSVSFEPASIDIDTPTDYELLRASERTR